MCLQDRKRRCLVCVAVALLVVVVAVSLGVTLGLKKTFKETFIARCNQFKGNDCEKIWSTFERAYVGRDHCKVPPDAYNLLFELVPITLPRDKAMFWSKTKNAVHDYVSRNKDCFVTMEDTLLGSVLDEKALEVWCGKEGSYETFTTGCPEWDQKNCKTNPRRSFWTKGSATFAEAASGDATAMLSGSEKTPFNTSSLFAETEVPKLKAPKVKKLTVVLVMPKNPKSSCSHESFGILRQRLDREISYECKEVDQSQIEQCSSTAGTCTACW